MQKTIRAACYTQAALQSGPADALNTSISRLELSVALATITFALISFQDNLPADIGLAYARR